jgi:hypothetical protein
MERRESFVSQRSFPEICQYVQTAFFPRLKEQGVGAVIQLLSPRIVANESSKFAMMKVLEKRMTLRVEVEQSTEGKVFVTVASSLGMVSNIVGAVIASVFTCGLAALILGPLLYWKYSRWNTNVQKAVNLLKADLAI